MTRVAMVGNADILTSLAERLRAQDISLDVVELTALREEDNAEVVVGWDIPQGVLRHFPRLKLLHSPAAGCDHLLRDSSLATDVAICRVVDDAQREGMAAFVLWAVIYYQRDMQKILDNRSSHRWEPIGQRPLPKTRVGVMGLGSFGADAAHKLAFLGMEVRGWSRGPRQLEGVRCFAGEQQFDAFLDGLDIVICLLPLTDSTVGILNLATFERLAEGAVVINLGRGEHLVEEELKLALDRGILSAALLDVFTTEPLPTSSWLWKDSRVLITPHIASSAAIDTISEQVLDNINRMREGRPLANQIDRTSGY